jgi:hypothetical protein
MLLLQQATLNIRHQAIKISLNIATCWVVRVMKLMCSRSGEWIYWCSFTVTLSYDSLQLLTVYDLLHSVLDHECLPFCYEE